MVTANPDFQVPDPRVTRLIVLVRCSACMLLDSFMNGTRAANNARAKTGTLTGVTALSGYVTGRDGRRYVYSMVSNYSGSTPRPVENDLVVALARWDG